MKLHKLARITSIALSCSGISASAQVAADWGSVSNLTVALTYSYTAPGNVAKDDTGKPIVPATPSVEEEYTVITKNAAGVETKRVETQEFVTKVGTAVKYGNAEIIKELVDDNVLPKKGKAPFTAGWSLVVVAKANDDLDDDGIDDEDDTDDDNDGIDDEDDLDDDNDGINDEDDDGDIDGDGILDDVDTDDDNDGTPDATDTDDDGDGTPDATDTDEDNDGISDEEDDGDLDNDGVEDEDELEETVYARHTDKTMVELDGITFNIAGQEDEDEDEGDDADADEGDDDFDNDGIDDEVDTDDDDDGILDDVDTDDDDDGILDDVDTDDDQDGIPDAEEDDDDFDNDGIDNEDDLDDDGDGTPDATDLDDDGDGTNDDLDDDDDNDGIDDEEEAEADDEDDGDSDNDGILDATDLDDDNDGIADDDDEDDDGDGDPDSEEAGALTGAALARVAKEVKTTTTSATGVKTVVRTLSDVFSFKAEGYGEARGETFRGIYSETGSKVVIQTQKIGALTIQTDLLLTGAAKLDKIIGSTSAPLTEDAIYSGVIEGSMSTTAAVATDMNVYLPAD